jgi:hypothetical protein
MLIHGSFIIGSLINRATKTENMVVGKEQSQLKTT